MIGLVLTASQVAQADTFDCAAGNVGCLIASIDQANANGEENIIRLDAGTYPLFNADNITNGPNGLPAITSKLTIKAHGPDMTSIVRAFAAGFLSPGPAFRLVYVAPNGNLTLEGLTLSSGQTGNDNGGALLNEGIVVLKRTIVSGNYSLLDGGGIANGTFTNRSAVMTITESTVIGNHSDGPGGIANYGTLRVTKSRFTGNVGSHIAGGIGVFAGSVVVSRTSFDNNDADGSGGIGVVGFANAAASLIIRKSEFVENSGNGPAIGLSSTTTAIITNTTFARNRLSPPAGGGGIAIGNAGKLRLTNVTMVDNDAGVNFGSALATSAGATTIIQNTIVARSTNRFGIVPDCAGPTTSLGNNLIGNPTGCTITLQPTDLIGDPGLGLFTDNGTPGNGHYPLLPGSPAINAGDPAACPKKDQIGQIRAPLCDIGAIRFTHQLITSLN